jgi:hypothetical protein
MRAFALVALVTLSAAPARAGEGAGQLRCSIAGGIGFGPAGKRATTCVYYRRDGRTEFYIGSLTRIGLDIGPAQARNAIFEVSTRVAEPVGALEGEFVGAGVGVTLGRGLAGDSLIGGRSGTVAIEPIANSRLTGLNVNVGVAGLALRYAGTESQRERYRGSVPEGLD